MKKIESVKDFICLFHSSNETVHDFNYVLKSPVDGENYLVNSAFINRYVGEYTSGVFTGTMPKFSKQLAYILNQEEPAGYSVAANVSHDGAGNFVIRVLNKTETDTVEHSYRFHAADASIIVLIERITCVTGKVLKPFSKYHIQFTKVGVQVVDNEECFKPLRELEAYFKELRSKAPDASVAVVEGNDVITTK